MIDIIYVYIYIYTQRERETHTEIVYIYTESMHTHASLKTCVPMCARAYVRVRARMCTIYISSTAPSRWSRSPFSSILLFLLPLLLVLIFSSFSLLLSFCPSRHLLSRLVTRTCAHIHQHIPYSYVVYRDVFNGYKLRFLICYMLYERKPPSPQKKPHTRNGNLEIRRNISSGQSQDCPKLHAEVLRARVSERAKRKIYSILQRIL